MESIVEWAALNGGVLSALTGVGTLIVWLIYLQIFASSYRRQLRATLLITRGAGQNDGTHCFVSNMSANPVYIQSVLVTLETDSFSITSAATDIDDIAEQENTPSRDRTRQGPLHPGEMKDIGTFRSLMAPGIRREKIKHNSIRALWIEVLAIYGSEDLPVGARRRFILAASNSGTVFQGETIRTQQIRTRHGRKRLERDLKQDK